MVFWALWVAVAVLFMNKAETFVKKKIKEKFTDNVETKRNKDDWEW